MNIDNNSEDFVVVKNPLISYDKLYSYLYSRGFNYLLPIVSISDLEVVFKKVYDVSVDNYQKSSDLLHLVSLLHSKTSYFKEVSLDKYKEIYDDLLSNIRYMSDYYNNLFDEFIEDDMYPSRYLFLRNYTIIYSALNVLGSMVDEWFNGIKDDTRQRVCLCHGNLKLDYYIRNEEEYLTDFQYYSFDIPVLDLYKFYLNEWENINVEDFVNVYNKGFELLDNEKKLLNILILIPYKIYFNDDEFNNTKNVRMLLDYLSKSFKLVWPE